MSRRSKAKRVAQVDDRGPVQRLIDRERTQADAEPALSPYAERHGHYGEETVVDLTGELGGGQQKTYKVMLNRGGTAIERWLAAGSLNRQQAEAITLYSRAWRTAIGEQRVTANWSLTATIRGVSAAEWVADREDALARLKDMDQTVFRLMPPHYVDVWKNVVIFDEAAGVAGSRLGFTHKQAEASAKLIVMLVADMIASAYRL